MSRIDLHNAYLFVLLFVPLLIVRFTSEHGWFFGAAAGGILFVLLAGRVLTRSIDLRKFGRDDWHHYTIANIAFNAAAGLATFALFAWR